MGLGCWGLAMEGWIECPGDAGVFLFKVGV